MAETKKILKSENLFFNLNALILFLGMDQAFVSETMT
jgi:hypothetical protein